MASHDYFELHFERFPMMTRNFLMPTLEDVIHRLIEEISKKKRLQQQDAKDAVYSLSRPAGGKILVRQQSIDSLASFEHRGSSVRQGEREHERHIDEQTMLERTSAPANRTSFGGANRIFDVGSFVVMEQESQNQMIAQHLDDNENYLVDQIDGLNVEELQGDDREGIKEPASDKQQAHLKALLNRQMHKGQRSKREVSRSNLSKGVLSPILESDDNQVVE